MTSAYPYPASTNQTLQDTILALVATTLGIKLGKAKLDDPLFSGQVGFDSFSLMEFVLHLEDAFGISIPDEELDPDIFYSVRTVANYVCTHLQQREIFGAPGHS